MTNLGKTIRPDDIEGLIKLECGLYGKPTNNWTQKHFKHQTWQKGDMISWTCRKIVEDNDQSPWANDALEECFMLLQRGIRWPDELNHPNDAKTWLGWKTSYLWFKIRYAFVKPVPLSRKYRPQHIMTRDPYIYFFRACAQLGLWHYIDHTDLPWYIYSKTTWMWWKALKSQEVEDIIDYAIQENKQPTHKKDYVKLLKHYRKETINILIMKING